MSQKTTTFEDSLTELEQWVSLLEQDRHSSLDDSLDDLEDSSESFDDNDIPTDEEQENVPNAKNTPLIITQDGKPTLENFTDE